MALSDTWALSDPGSGDREAGQDEDSQEEVHKPGQRLASCTQMLHLGRYTGRPEKEEHCVPQASKSRRAFQKGAGDPLTSGPAGPEKAWCSFLPRKVSPGVEAEAGRVE
jgi:hypothetical protein